MKHFNDLDDTGLMRVHNKKGGANQPLFDIKYDYSTPMFQSAHGTPVNRVLNYDVTNMMASESASSLGNFNKLTPYGNLTELNNGPFIYGGAQRKKTSASTRPPKPQKPTNKKPTKTPRKKQS